jgi:glutathione S-transferase
LVARGRRRIADFYDDLETRLVEVPFVAGDQFSVADITAVVAIDFAKKH